MFSFSRTVGRVGVLKYRNISKTSPCNPLMNESQHDTRDASVLGKDLDLPYNK